MLKKISEHKVLSLIIAGLLILTIFRFVTGGVGTQNQKRGQQAIFVELGEATFGTMREVGLYYGSLTASQKFAVSPRVGGPLKNLMVDIGDRLESGQLLAVLDDSEYRIARDKADHDVRLAEAQYAEAQANLSLAQSDMNRQTSLADKRIVSQSDFEAAENKLRQAEARLKVAGSQLSGAESQLADAALRLSYTQIRAHWAGTEPRFIAERKADEGDLLSANTPILTVVSLNPLLVVVEVIEKDYPKIQIGQKAALRTEAWPGETFQAKVVRVAPVLSENTRQARVELEVENPDFKLKPGMFTEVLFTFKEIKNVWSVPQDVPFRRSEGFVIFLADPETKTVRLQTVELGLIEGDMIELVNAQPVKLPIVFLGQHLLEDGFEYRLPPSSEKKPVQASEDTKNSLETNAGTAKESGV